jgi:Protein of unknown function (DUF742)
VPAPKHGRPDEDPGPFVRPYAITRGRTAPAGGSFIGLIDMVVVDKEPPSGMALAPEHRELLARCEQPTAMADLASDMNLPTGVVRVLLGDLRESGIVHIVSMSRPSDTNQRLLQEVLDGLRTL